MVIENIDIFQPHPSETLIDPGKQVLPAAKIAVGAGPHIIARLGRDDQLVAVRQQILLQDPAERPLGLAVGRAVIICKVKIGNAVVKCCQKHLLLLSRVIERAKVVPQAEAQQWEHQPAPAAPAVLHLIISVVSGLKFHKYSPFLPQKHRLPAQWGERYAAVRRNFKYICTAKLLAGQQRRGGRNCKDHPLRQRPLC